MCIHIAWIEPHDLLIKAAGQVPSSAGSYSKGPHPSLGRHTGSLRSNAHYHQQISCIFIISSKLLSLIWITNVVGSSSYQLSLIKLSCCRFVSVLVKDQFERCTSTLLQHCVTTKQRVSHKSSRVKHRCSGLRHTVMGGLIPTDQQILRIKRSRSVPKKLK